VSDGTDLPPIRVRPRSGEAPPPPRTIVHEPSEPVTLEALIGQTAARLDALARRVADAEARTDGRLQNVEASVAAPPPELDLTPLERALTEQLTTFGRRVAGRVETLSEAIADVSRNAAAAERRLQIRLAAVQRPAGDGPAPPSIEGVLDARQAAIEGLLAARLHEVRQMINELQSALAPLPGRIAAVAERVDEKAAPAAAPAGALVAVRAQLTEELGDLREELRTVGETRGELERVVRARVEEALQRVEGLDGALQGLAGRVAELETSAPAEDQAEAQGRLPLGIEPGDAGADRVESLERRLDALERGHQALTQLAERTARETSQRLSRRIEDLRDAFSVQLAELRRSLERQPPARNQPVPPRPD
jgi:hypothetical protein